MKLKIRRFLHWNGLVHLAQIREPTQLIKDWTNETDSANYRHRFRHHCTRPIDQIDNQITKHSSKKCKCFVYSQKESETEK